jgi:hypothetical protein
MSTAPALLVQDRIDRFRPFGAFGKPVYQSHVQLRAMLRSKRGERFADYFANPNYDPDCGHLRWTAHTSGVARGWHEMSAEEQARHGLDLEVIRSGLVGFVQELRAQGGAEPGGAAAFSSLLELAMKVPAQGDFLYFVGDQPVIAFWGFENQAGASVDPAGVVPQAPPPLPPELPASLAAPPPAAPAAAPPAAVARRPWWLWLLLALLALVLLAALFFGLKSCSAAPPTLVAPSAPVASQPEPAASVAVPVASAPAPVASQPEPAASAPEPAASAPPLIDIPEGALERKDLSFLEGEWTYGTLSTYGKDPKRPTGRVRMLLQFDGRGGGSVRGTDRLADGRAAPDCTGGLRTRTDGRKLYITEEDCRVRGQPGVGASRMECERNADGRTLCFGVNSDGVRWSTELRKIK